MSEFVVKRTGKARNRPSGRARTSLQKKREAAFERQGGLCYYCKKPMKRLDELPITNMTVSAEHLVPWADGGSNGAHNIVAACRACNSKRPAEVSSVNDLMNKHGLHRTQKAKNHTLAHRLIEAFGMERIREILRQRKPRSP